MVHNLSRWNVRECTASLLRHVSHGMMVTGWPGRMVTGSHPCCHCVQSVMHPSAICAICLQLSYVRAAETAVSVHANSLTQGQYRGSPYHP